MELRTDITYKRDMILLSLSMLISLIFMLFTNPRTMSALWLLVLPILTFINSFYIAKLVLKFFTGYNEVKIKTVSAVLAAGPALVIVLGSLGSIGLQDIVLAFLFVSGLSWYLRRYQTNSGTL